MLSLVIFPNWVKSCWQKRCEQTNSINNAKIEHIPVTIPVVQHSNFDIKRCSPKIESEIKNMQCTFKHFQEDYCRTDENWADNLPKTEIPILTDNYSILNKDLYLSATTHYSLIVTLYGCDVIPESFFDYFKASEFRNSIQSHSTLFHNLCETKLLGSYNALPQVPAVSSHPNLVYHWFINKLTAHVETADNRLVITRELPVILHTQEFSDSQICYCFHQQNKANLLSFITVATERKSKYRGEINIIGEIFQYLAQPAPAALTTATVKPWPELVPTVNPSHAKYCGDVGLILPDLLQSVASPQRFSTLCMFSSDSLLNKHATNTALPVKTRHSTLLSKLSGAVERLVDFQSPWVLMPVAKEATPTDAPHRETSLNITPTLCALLPHKHHPPLPQTSSKRKRDMRWLERSCAAVGPLAHLGELVLSSEDKQPPRKKSRTRGRRGLAAFVETASMQGAPIAPIPTSISESPASLGVVTNITTRSADAVAQPSVAPTPLTLLTAGATATTAIVAGTGLVAAPAPPQSKLAVHAPHLPVATDLSAAAAPKAASPSLPETNNMVELPNFLNESESMVEQYLRLQRGVQLGARPAQVTGLAGPAASTSRIAQPHKVTPQRHGPAATTTTASSSLPEDSVRNIQATSTAAVPVSPQQPSNTKERIVQLAAHNIDGFHCGTHPLRILVSENFLEEHYLAVGALSSQYGVEMIDCPLETPVSLILDACTAVCVVPVASIVDRTTLKALVKQLSAVTFKFSCIYVVGLLSSISSSSDTPEQNQAFLTLCQALARFPAQVVLRQCPTQPDTLAFMLSQVCKQCLRDALQHGATVPSNVATPTVERYFERPFLQQLQVGDPQFQMHCEFLQLFPTMNIFTAAALLHHFPLRELCATRLQHLRELFNTHYISNEEVEIALKGFVGLLKEPFEPAM